jgi:hemerythrin
MDELVFTDDLLTGEDTVDYQHKVLIGLINDLIRANKFSENVELIVEITIDELIKYTIHHFNDEELIMKKRGYVSLAHHQEQHKDFANKVVDYKNRHSNGEKINNELLKFLTTWLIRHIKHEDQLPKLLIKSY